MSLPVTLGVTVFDGVNDGVTVCVAVTDALALGLKKLPPKQREGNEHGAGAFAPPAHQRPAPQIIPLEFIDPAGQ